MVSLVQGWHSKGGLIIRRGLNVLHSRNDCKVIKRLIILVLLQQLLVIVRRLLADEDWEFLLSEYLPAVALRQRKRKGD